MPQELQRLCHCLNCGEAVTGNFCSQCGQENEDKTVSLKFLISDFLADVISFDSKLTRTIIPLVIRPGFLTNEYIEGHRVSYLSPLKMYIFMSVVFFLVMAYRLPINSIPAGDPTKSSAASTISPKTGKTRNRQNIIVKGPPGFNMKLSDLPETEDFYIDEQSKRPPAQRDSKFRQFIIRQTYKAKNDPRGFSGKIIDNIPKMMFFLLPFFALFLMIIYIRRKRLYVEHLIFALHCHAFVLLILTITSIFQQGWLTGVSFLFMTVYLFKAMRVVYKQSLLKTGFKFIVLGFLYNIVLVMCLLGTLFITFLLL
jgi:hypothetical protein